MIRLDPKASPDDLLDELRIRHVADIDVDAIAQYCNATVIYAPMSGCEGRILGVKQRALISVDSNQPLTRQRFTAGHELGHWMNDRNRAAFACTGAMLDLDWETPSLERRANEFSANLLMPRRFFRPAVLGRDVTFETVSSLAADFKVSMSAAAIKIVDDGDLPAMLIACKNGKRVWFRPGPDVPKSLFPRSVPLKNSYSHEYFSGGFSGGDPQPVESNAWFETKQGWDYEIVEDIISVSRDLTLTLLWWKDEQQIVDLAEEE